MLTEKQRAAYINDPTRCPYCESGDIVGESISPADSVSAVRPVSCDDCGLMWSEILTVTGLDEMLERA